MAQASHVGEQPAELPCLVSMIGQNIYPYVDAWYVNANIWHGTPRIRSGLPH